MTALPLVLWLFVAYQWSWQPRILRQAYSPMQMNGLHPLGPLSFLGTSLEFSADGSLLTEHTIYTPGVHLWDVAGGGLKSSLNAPYSDDESFSAALSSDAKTVASSDFNGSLRLYDVQTGFLRRLVAANNFQPQAIAFWPDGKTLTGVSGGQALGVSEAESRQFKVTLWDVATAKVKHVTRLIGPAIELVILQQNGRTLFTLNHDKTISLWDIETGRTKKIWPPIPAQDFRNDFEAKNDFAISSDGKTAAWANDDFSVTLWNIQAAKVQQILKGANTRMKALVFSPDGTMIGGVTNERINQNAVRIWDIPGGTLRLSLKSRHDPFFARICFSPDGHTLATRSSDGELTLWRVR
ncbi:MAG: hypothetical protein JO316_14265 [Abitibacteriaceae bacterium]|nr:hypothetical protein [Abditibacteriaceae bacterium]MBV9866514.1 hypothetical protein [Abditibacteriaceae bacterium]